MAMIECPECKNQVSDRATTCPNCGYPIASYAKKMEKENKKKLLSTPSAKKKKLKILIISLVVSICVIAIIVGISVPFSKYKNCYDRAIMFAKSAGLDTFVEDNLNKIPSYYKDTKKIKSDYSSIKYYKDLLNNCPRKEEWSQWEKGVLQNAFINLRDFREKNMDTVFSQEYIYRDIYLFLNRDVRHQYNFSSSNGNFLYFSNDDKSFSTNLPKPTFPTSYYNEYYWEIKYFNYNGMEVLDHSHIYYSFWNNNALVANEDAFDIKVNVEDLSTNKVNIEVYCYKNKQTYILYAE